MSDNDKPNALEDVRKGLGLLFRAAKTTVEKLPTKDVEDAVITTAREVGRAVENVGRTLEREVFGGKDAKGKNAAAASPADAPHAGAGASEGADAKPGEPKKDAGSSSDTPDQKS